MPARARDQHTEELRTAELPDRCWPRWSGYGYCASHSRWFWGLRLHLVCTPPGLPIAWSLASPKIDDRQALTAVLEENPHLTQTRPGQLIIVDKGYICAEPDRWLAERGIRLLRPSYRNRTPRPDERLFKTSPTAHRVGQRHPQRPTRPGTALRPQHRRRRHPRRQRLLAMTAAIWHKRATGQPVTSSLIAYDH